MVRDFQSIVGREARAQFLEKQGKLPDIITACVGGGSNAIGLFTAFLNDVEVKMVGVEPAGKGLDTPVGVFDRIRPGLPRCWSATLLFEGYRARPV